jgi:dihydrofolate reductase
VSSLIEQGLIDEMNLFVNPVAIGSGMRIFKGKTPLKRAASTAYPCGIVVNSYLPSSSPDGPPRLADARRGRNGPSSPACRP